MVLKALRKLPEPIKKLIRPIGSRLVRKEVTELSNWRRKHQTDDGAFWNSHYEALILAMAQEPDDGFLKGKIVADFGCGPRASLFWAKSVSMSIGIEVLAQRSAEAFPEDILKHDMLNVASTDKSIPLPLNSVDVMVSLRR